jgi:hypothetical protein
MNDNCELIIMKFHVITNTLNFLGFLVLIHKKKKKKKLVDCRQTNQLLGKPCFCQQQSSLGNYYGIFSNAVSCLHYEASSIRVSNVRISGKDVEGIGRCLR